MVVALRPFHGPDRSTPTCCECSSDRLSATQTKSTHWTHSERFSQCTATHACYATELAVRLLLPTTLSAPRAALLQGCTCAAASSPPDSTPPDSTAPRIAAPRIALPPGYIRAAQLSVGWCYPRVPLGAVPFETCTPSPSAPAPSSPAPLSPLRTAARLAALHAAARALLGGRASPSRSSAERGPPVALHARSTVAPSTRSSANGP